MLIVYIALALISGIAAAITALMAGTGILLAIAAYAAAASITITLCALWILLPLAGPEPQVRLQRT